MPKKPNYDFERRERDRLKAQKTAAKNAAKLEQRQRLRDAEAYAAESGAPAPTDED